MATPSVAAVIDVRTYGAIPNDSVDDSLAIQKAIDAAPDNSTIYFPRGTYLAVECDDQSSNWFNAIGRRLDIDYFETPRTVTHTFSCRQARRICSSPN